MTTRAAKIVSGVAVTFLLCVSVPSSSAAQEAAEKAQLDAVIVRLSPPVYPAIARTAHISGKVVLKIGVHKDGTVKSSEFVSGPALLGRAAIDSATGSTFDCPNCEEDVTFYGVIYSFQLIDRGCCSANESDPQPQDGQAAPPAEGVSQSGNRITVTADVVCLCDPRAHVGRVRSLKCLYLRKCGGR
ncbi:MAG TPA: energy transducer TonB [Candidatus Acidoferrales bacterium]|nr:energy transducer TonB [Candidatus Acidoferrales bacterium]